MYILILILSFHLLLQSVTAAEPTTQPADRTIKKPGSEFFGVGVNGVNRPTSATTKPKLAPLEERIKARKAAQAKARARSATRYEASREAQIAREKAAGTWLSDAEKKKLAADAKKAHKVKVAEASLAENDAKHDAQDKQTLETYAAYTYIDETMKGLTKIHRMDLFCILAEVQLNKRSYELWQGVRPGTNTRDEHKAVSWVVSSTKEGVTLDVVTPALHVGYSLSRYRSRKDEIYKAMCLRARGYWNLEAYNSALFMINKWWINRNTFQLNKAATLCRDLVKKIPVRVRLYAKSTSSYRLGLLLYEEEWPSKSGSTLRVVSKETKLAVAQKRMEARRLLLQANSIIRARKKDWEKYANDNKRQAERLLQEADELEARPFKG